MTLSTESTRFLEDLKVYLLASGKNEQATNEIVLELEDHLIEAEADGKSVRSITGDSPAAYIQSISHEMAFDSNKPFGRSCKCILCIQLSILTKSLECTMTSVSCSSVASY